MLSGLVFELLVQLGPTASVFLLLPFVVLAISNHDCQGLVFYAYSLVSLESAST